MPYELNPEEEGFDPWDKFMGILAMLFAIAFGIFYQIWLHK